MGSEKAAKESDVGLCLKMQRTEMFPCKKKTILMPQHLPSSSETTVTDFGCTDGGGGGSSGGPIFSSRSNQVVGCLSDDVYDVVGAGSGIPQARNTRRFNSDSSFKSSSGGIMGASVRVPFTSVQLQELERQTIIYKYIIASVPIPPQLLVPIAKSRHDFHVSKSNRSWELGYPQNGTDPEPWRCKRTDGKKWRCSRDVAPDQKYCERHAHKNRPRSRKPVELVQQTHSNTSTSSNNSNKNKNHPPLINLPSTNNKLFNHRQQKSQIFNQTMDQFVSPFPAAVSPYEQQPRCSDWSMKGEETASVTSSNQQWQNMQFTVGLNDNLAGTSLGDVENDSCSLFLGPKLASLEGALNIDQTERPIRGFIDAWSTAQRESINRCSVSSDGKLPLSSLTLSMAGINGPNQEQEENVPMGLGILDPDRENAGDFKTQSFLNWMSPDSWMGSPPGGPLAEALCLGMASTAKMGSNPNSPHGCNSSVTNSSHDKSPSGDSSQGQGQGQGLNLI